MLFTVKVLAPFIKSNKTLHFSKEMTRMFTYFQKKKDKISLKFDEYILLMHLSWNKKKQKWQGRNY